MPIIGLQWLFRRGPASTNHFEAGAFVRSNPSEPYPNLMFHFFLYSWRFFHVSKKYSRWNRHKLNHAN